MPAPSKMIGRKTKQKWPKVKPPRASRFLSSSVLLSDPQHGLVSNKTTLESEGEELSHRSLDEVDAGLQVQAKVDEAPLNALPLVLLLLQDEHGVVEELLQLLVGVVDAQLLKRVQLGEEEEKGYEILFK